MGKTRRKPNDRREGAEIRQNVYKELSVEERLKKLDQRLGKGVGAIKERAKLELKRQESKEKAE